MRIIFFDLKSCSNYNELFNRMLRRSTSPFEMDTFMSSDKTAIYGGRLIAKLMLLFLLILLYVSVGFSQSNDWLSVYPECKEQSIKDRFFKHQHIENLILSLDNDERWKYKEVGKSIEGKEIYLLKIGDGPRNVLLWTQMHGDEPTATMAVMDLINFFGKDNLYPDWKERVLNELSIYILPMLNPDGAEKFDRRNAAYIDLNRDARRLQCPESVILKRMVDSLKPEFGFNLHDQSKYYAAGFQSDSTASFSFLAPPYNYQRSVNPVRMDAMQLIASLDEYVQRYLPGKVGRYSGSFEPRAFGDNITKWGTSTILIEVGGLKNDPEKQELRRIHFGLLLHAFDCISKNCYQQYTQKDYEDIPSNSRILEDLILRNVIWELNGNELLVDFAFKREELEVDDHSDVIYRGQLVDVGDLSTSKAYTQIDCDSSKVVAPKVYPRIFEESEFPEMGEVQNMVRSGYSVAYINMSSIPAEFQEGPLRWVRPGDIDSWKIELGGNPNFYLKDPDSGALIYLINNGIVYSLDND